MADNSAIEWTSATWNPIVGCSVLSPGCTNCYAMPMAARIEKMMAALGKPTPYAGLTQPSKAGPVWNGRIAVASDETLTQPLRWKRPRRIFVNSMSDLFHQDVADETIDRVFAVMALCPQHTFQVLTKRAARMREYFEAPHPAGNVRAWQARVLEKIDELAPERTDASRAARDRVLAAPLPNVWLGVSTEDQLRADERIPHLLATPAAVRFISAEPLLGAIDLGSLRESGWHRIDSLAGLSIHDETPNQSFNMISTGRIDWVIAGGESGPKARPSHPDWFRWLRNQCAAAGVPFFFKQWGEWGPVDPTRKAECHAIGDDGKHYLMSDLAWPDGARRGDAIRADFNRLKPCTTYRVGKKAAGAELDGKMHREFPR